MSIKKQYLKSKPVCKVTFKVEKELSNGAEKISLLGDFNDWSESTAEMKKMKDGSFSTTVELESGREYQFRYLAGSNWITEAEADKQVPSGFGDAQNAVISL
ncbi:MAG: isoamylase early set domain-containing protein [Bacteroidales bacterium]|nr:isoamylase early set domain-containing protein [Bacteroidales bacterium]